MNYKHLQYFWAVARLGGVVKASEHLHVTPQTVSGQIQLLEAHFGRPLFQKQGRGLVLTETGQLAYSYAKDIFSLGEELDQVVRQPRGTPRPMPLRVGIADAVPKMVAAHLLAPVLQAEQHFRVECHEWKLDSLLAELAVHRLDLVLSDRPLPAEMSVQAFHHRLGGAHVGFYASKTLAARLGRRFPACLDGVPLLAPAADSALGMRLTQWLGTHKLKPRIIGEFDDSALTNVLGQLGCGVFLSPMVLDEVVRPQHGARLLGQAKDLVESFYVITVERRITHPGVALIAQSAREGFFTQLQS